MVQFEEQTASLHGGLLKGSDPVYVSVSRFLHYPSVPVELTGTSPLTSTTLLESSHVDITPGRPQTDEQLARKSAPARKAAPASEEAKCMRLCPSMGEACRQQCGASKDPVYVSVSRFLHYLSVPEELSGTSPLTTLNPRTSISRPVGHRPKRVREMRGQPPGAEESRLPGPW